MKIKHVIWDWNGTLFNDAWLCLEGINKLLKKQNKPVLSEEKYMDCFTFPVEDYYVEAGFDLNAESFEKLGTEFMEYYKDNIHRCSLRDGAKETLATFLNNDISQSILSAYKHTWLEQIVSAFSLNEYFTGLLGCEDYYAYGKVENGLQWIKTLNCCPEEVIMIGDTIHDVEVAKAMGTKAILIEGGNQSLKRLKTCNVPVISCLHELPELLSNL